MKVSEWINRHVKSKQVKDPELDPVNMVIKAGEELQKLRTKIVWTKHKLEEVKASEYDVITIHMKGWEEKWGDIDMPKHFLAETLDKLIDSYNESIEHIIDGSN